MKGRNPKRKPIKGKNNTNNQDSNFKQNNSKKRRKEQEDSFFINDNDAEILSEDEDSEDGDGFFNDGGGEKGSDDEEDDVVEDRETVEEKRRRLALEFVEKVRKSEKLRREEEDLDDEENEIGERDALVKKLLQQEQLEETGRARRFIASKIKKPETDEEPGLLVKHHQTVTAVALSEDDRRGFSASKDGSILHWDVETGKAEKYLWPTETILKDRGHKDPKGRTKKHSKQVLSLALSSDGRYLATGGLDRHIHLWDTRAREHIRAFAGHKQPVSCLTFRQGTSELFSGSLDKEPRIWNADDRSYTQTLFGANSDVLTIDCLRKERVLGATRGRQMLLWKVPEETRLVFNASGSSFESCCFVSNDEFLSGADDGSVQLWSILRKKPVFIAKNAHAIGTAQNHVTLKDDGRLPNGHIEGDLHEAQTPCSSARSWVGCVSVCSNSDFAASGAGNGFVRLWAIESEKRVLRPLFGVPLTGYVNSLAIAKSGRFLIAGVGQEPRLGRWDRNTSAKNGVALQSFNLLS